MLERKQFAYYSQSSDGEGPEYRKNQGKVIRFEAFLRNTDQKEQSAMVASAIIQTTLPMSGGAFLDIGTGNGEYLRLIQENLPNHTNIRYLLLEPAKDLLPLLEQNVLHFSRDASVVVASKKFEDFARENTEKKFDIVLAAHLYHIPVDKYSEQIRTMLDFVSPSGRLLFIHRTADDIHRFKRQFKPQLHGGSYDSRTIDHVEKAVEQIGATRSIAMDLQYSDYVVRFPQNDAERHAIVELFLGKQWEQIPTGLQNGIENFISERGNIIAGKEAIAVIGNV